MGRRADAAALRNFDIVRVGREPVEFLLAFCGHCVTGSNTAVLLNMSCSGRRRYAGEAGRAGEGRE